MKKVLFMFSFLQILLFNRIVAQNIDNAYTTDTSTSVLSVIMLDPIYLTSERIYKTDKDRLKDLKLQRDVNIAFKYATDLVNEINHLNYELLRCKTIRERKLTINKYYNKLKGKIVNISKELTPAQGKIILKLINRQTGYTTYQLLSDKLNNFNANLMYILAKSLGQDLKASYNIIEDYEIEAIVRKLEKFE